MVWVKLDDGYFRHRKNRAGGKDGRALDLAGICWAAAQKTDGFVADTDLPLVAVEAGVKPSVARRLVEVDRWERGEKDGQPGHWIHDFLAYNPSAAEAADKREKRAAAGRKGGLKSRPPASKPEANASADAQADGKRNGTPSPSPEGIKSSVLPVDSALETEARRRTDTAVANGQVRGNPDRYRQAVVADLRATGWTPPDHDFLPGTGHLRTTPVDDEPASPRDEALAELQKIRRESA